MELKGRKKKLGFKRFIESFKYSFEGLKNAYLNEQSMMIHCIITVFVVGLGFILKINNIEWIIVLIMVGLVMAMELMNTAIEAVVDMVMPDIHPLAKIAKDSASAAVGVLSLVAFIIGCIVFLPNIISLF
ncbi:MAG: diacylglycerol kinase family protein [Bacilli bacterium]